MALQHFHTVDETEILNVNQTSITRERMSLMEACGHLRPQIRHLNYSLIVKILNINKIH